MNETLFALLDFGLVFGAVLGLGVWRLRMLRRDRRRKETARVEGGRSGMRDDRFA